MKVQIVKQSGKPVEPEAALAFEAEFREMYDKAETKAEKLAQKTGKPVMKLLERYLSFAELLMNRKHNQDQFITLPTSARAWRTLIDKHGNIPILVAKRSDKKATVLVIMDSGL